MLSSLFNSILEILVSVIKQEKDIVKGVNPRKKTIK